MGGQCWAAWVSVGRQVQVWGGRGGLGSLGNVTPHPFGGIGEDWLPLLPSKLVNLDSRAGTRSQ